MDVTFSPFLGVTWLVCQAAALFLRGSPPAPRQEVAALCSPLLDLKCELPAWENSLWIPPGCKAAAVLLFLGTIRPSPALLSRRDVGFDFETGTAGCSPSLTTPLRSGFSWKILVPRDGGADGRISFMPTFLTLPRAHPCAPLERSQLVALTDALGKKENFLRQSNGGQEEVLKENS